MEAETDNRDLYSDMIRLHGRLPRLRVALGERKNLC
jgi:hypothetical protein